ncbi:MAG: hypothetical protein PHE59_00110 [Patescibacteria group bacterium]|nr:hypothetical protein [Patescibacteria group bacterium]MDD5164574.1 hypothetical protein [Patescibacteria group bacterium]MDD5534329.1 hypothetical protein [Patescibacteria group bacterium]
MEENKSSLDEFLRRLIAKREGIEPEEVTCKKIRELRKKHNFVIMNFFRLPAIRIITPKEAKIIEKKFDDFINDFSFNKETGNSKGIKNIDDLKKILDKTMSKKEKFKLFLRRLFMGEKATRFKKISPKEERKIMAEAFFAARKKGGLSSELRGKRFHQK